MCVHCKHSRCVRFGVPTGGDCQGPSQSLSPSKARSSRVGLPILTLEVIHDTPRFLQELGNEFGLVNKDVGSLAGALALQKEYEREKTCESGVSSASFRGSMVLQLYLSFCLSVCLFVCFCPFLSASVASPFSLFSVVLPIHHE